MQAFYFNPTECGPQGLAAEQECISKEHALQDNITHLCLNLNRKEHPKFLLSPLHINYNSHEFKSTNKQT